MIPVLSCPSGKDTAKGSVSPLVCDILSVILGGQALKSQLHGELLSGAVAHTPRLAVCCSCQESPGKGQGALRA